MTNDDKKAKITELVTLLKPKYSDIRINFDEADNKGGKSEGATRIIEGDVQSESVEG
jgi:hypothetical protein